MDSQSRRFELIQLAFDAENASVKDVIGQISLSATEDTLRSQTYQEVCLPDGFLMKNDSFLKDYHNEIEAQNNMLLAVPMGMKTEECTKLAVPILNDPAVKSMLSGIDSPSRQNRNTQQASTDSAAPAKTTAAPTTNTDTSGPAGASFKLSLVLLAIVAPMLAYVQTVLTSPLSPGDVLPTGNWRSSCGLLAHFPKMCGDGGNKILNLSSDGTLSLTRFDDDNDEEEITLWEMQGKCKGETLCTATVGADGKITIGSTKGKLMEGAPGIAHPWPFVVEPSTKTKKRRKKKKTNKT